MPIAEKLNLSPDEEALFKVLIDPCRYNRSVGTDIFRLLLWYVLLPFVVYLGAKPGNEPLLFFAIILIAAEIIDKIRDALRARTTRTTLRSLILKVDGYFKDAGRT